MRYIARPVPELSGGLAATQVKATLKSERAKVPRRRFSSRQRTSRFMGVGSSNRKNQWQARILVHGKVHSLARTTTLLIAEILSEHASLAEQLLERLAYEALTAPAMARR